MCRRSACLFCLLVLLLPLATSVATAGMADGSVRFVSERVSPAVLRGLSTPAGGEDVDLSGLENPL